MTVMFVYNKFPPVACIIVSVTQLVKHLCCQSRKTIETQLTVTQYNSVVLLTKHNLLYHFPLHTWTVKYLSLDKQRTNTDVLTPV